MHSIPDDLALALELADIADPITRERFLASDLSVESKSDWTPVTEADTAAERALRDRLERERPDDAVLGEEFGEEGVADRRWILDPIDGTKNYVRGIPVWATLIALHEAGRPTIAVVSAPALGRRWWASHGDGAYVDDGTAAAPRRLRVSGVGELSDAQLSITGFHYLEEQGRLTQAFDLIRCCGRTRGFGDFWSYMLLAEGAVDVSVEPLASLWDLAAPQLIVEQAGGRFTDLDGVVTAAGGNAVASNGLLHDAALAIMGR